MLIVPKRPAGYYAVALYAMGTMMGKKAKELGALAVSRLRDAGMNFVGGVDGLALNVADGGSRSWILRYTLHGRRRDLGLGGYPDVTLADARDAARAAKALARNGIDPIDDARRRRMTPAVVAPAFSDYAASYIEAHRASWKNAKHAEQWTNTLKTYAEPFIGQLPVDIIDTSHLLAMLKPIWTTKTETATRVRGRVESILDAAASEGRRAGPNPARWKGHLDNLLPKPSKVAKVRHHPAMSIDRAPAYYRALCARPGISAFALRFLMLTAARTTEVRGLQDGEIAGDTWTVPAARMKAARVHRVPLGPEALAIVATVPRFAGSAYVFGSSARGGGMLSSMAMLELMREDADNAVPHGFRSTFRDWASERTDYAREVAEAALAHAITDETEAAYRRGDLFDKRRAMMLDWERFLTGEGT